MTIELIEAAGADEAHPFLVAAEMKPRDPRDIRHDVSLADE